MTADSERSMVQFGRTSIPYSIERGRRLKTVAIAVDSQRGVRVRAPRHTAVVKLDEIVRRRGKWITDRRREHEMLPREPTPREFVSGETFMYAGKQYRLKLVPRELGAGERVRLVGARLCVKADRQVRSSLVSWYRERAQERLDSRLRVWAERVGVRPARVLVREQRARWGSADSKGNLRFNWRIVQASTRLLDYVVAHELVHLRHADHTRDFWATLGRVMPDYEARRERLRLLGRALVW
jgi:predicted metal-dependent hydrolase